MSGESAFWNKSPEDLARELDSSPDGLSSAEAKRRLSRITRSQKRFSMPPTLKLLLSQFNNFITLILLFAAVLSIALKDTINGAIILCILLLTGLLSFWQEHTAGQAVNKLTAMVHVTVKIIRDGAPTEVPAETAVPGDVVILSAGDMVPGDSLILESKEFFVDESTLTGETFPAEKRPGTVKAEAQQTERVNALFFGTHIVSGTGRAIIAAVSKNTQLGEIKNRFGETARVTDFQRGLFRFSALLAKVTFSLVLAINAENRNRPR